MTRRWSLLAGAIALSLSVPQAAFATPQQPAGTAPGPDAAAADALRELKADAEGAVRVQRDAGGDVAFVSSTDGQAMLDSDASSPGGAAQDQLAEYGDAFGIDGTTSKAVVTQTLDSATGGSVVRADQVVDGVTVFGGQVVMSLDENQGVVSVTSATTDATQVPAAVVSQLQALRTAVSVTAKSHRVRADKLTASLVGRRFYDPALVHTSDSMGARPVWQFEVTNGSDIRETVLVGTGRGEVALHFNDAPEVSDPGMSRRVCDNNQARLTSNEASVPICTVAARSEGQGATGVADVNKAYDNLRATSDAYYELDGIGLTDLIGATVVGTKRLQSTVRWCFTEGDCPYDNAFWDGTQMVFGTGFPVADDVVGHELTHGYVERTSGLFGLNQSAAINESLADTIGEIVDHRNPLSPASDADWTIAEESPLGVLRSMKDPTLKNHPDKMTSSNYVTDDFWTDRDGVHRNAGVGNKAAYLISQGGTFNGQTVTGIDGSDAGLAKTGRLYLETIKRLTSGAQYADLGRTLVATCDELRVAGTFGFTTTNCDNVVKATTATELALQPTDPNAANAEAPSTCAAGARQVELRRDDEAVQEFGFTANGLWQRTPANDTPNYARSGASSWFGWNPDPSLDGIASSQITSSAFVVPASQPAYLRFNHAYVFEWYDAEEGFPAYYPDGGQVLVQTLSGSTWTTRAVTWDNGPAESLGDSTTKVFGGDSHGYGSSRVNLTSLAGQTARVIFKVTGDQNTYFIGWWVDDVRLSTCPNAVASVPATTVATATTSTKVSWTAPAYMGPARSRRTASPVRPGS